MIRNPLAGMLLLALVAPAAAAQSTGTPVFHAPYRIFDRYEVGGNVSNQGDITIEGFYGIAQSGGRWDFSFRVGIADDVGPEDRTALLAGVDARIRVIDQTEDFPLDGAIIVGAGTRLVQDGSRLFIPIGLSVGRRIDFENSTVSLVPYAEPVLVPNFGDGPDDDVAVALGLGADLRLSRRFEIRFAIGIGDIEDFSIGVAFAR
ncbi:MAG: hypothetical protein ACT4PM_14800 [Gemmatimonadales bacterium]